MANPLQYGMISAVIAVAIIGLVECSTGSSRGSREPKPVSSPPQLSEAARDEAWMAHNQDIVRQALRDPRSADFRAVHVYRPFAGDRAPIVCGEVNAKNGFGGKSGFQGFIAAGETLGPFLEEQMAPGEFEKARRRLCINA